jgi:hypothetical protein
MKKSLLLNLLLFISLFFFNTTIFAQSDNCVVGGSVLLTPGAAGAACSPVAYNTNAGFTDSNLGCVTGTEDDDGWFRFQATSVTHTITVDGAANMDPVLGVYTNCTSTLATGGTCVDATATDGIETRTITGLTIGSFYYICVHDFAAGGGDFTICITTPPAGDYCNTAISLTPTAAGVACSPTAGNTTTGFSDSNQGCTAGNEDDDIWYSFTAISSEHTVTVDGAADFNAVLGAYNSCSGGQPTGGNCINATGDDGIETLNLSGLTIGVTYYLSVHDNNNGGGNFTICVTTNAPNCATYSSPTDGGSVCSSGTTLTWTAPATGPAPSGYLMYFGTNNSPTNIVNGTNIGNVLTYNTGALTAGTTYYWRVVPVNSSGSATGCSVFSFTVNSCVVLGNGTTTVCSSTLYDSGGPSAAYSNNENITQVICPSTAGQCISATFTSWIIDYDFDVLYVFDGNSTASNQIAGSPFSPTSPGTVTATTNNSSGCLTFHWRSDGGFTDTGFEATISCTTCATVAAATAQDCEAGATVCNDQSFSGNSSGAGTFNELSYLNDGCLGGENQSSWYFFSPSASGTVALNITPANGTDDYDFAIWGPLASATCPPTSAPLRCSYAAVSGTTGLNASASPQTTEGQFGDGFVDILTVTAGQVYMLLVDNYTGSLQPFTLDWTMGSGASLSCVPLPIELLNFSGKLLPNSISLNWSTASEINNDYFTIERSSNGINFNEIAQKDGAGTSITTIEYSIIDNNPFNGINYYRLKQTDFDGTSKLSSIIGVEFYKEENLLNNIHPNPTTTDINFDFYSPISGIVKVQILDYTGRVVVEENMTVGEGKTSLNAKMGELAKGIYSLKVAFDQTGYNSVNMIIKQ